jgi:hypothetical protein
LISPSYLKSPIEDKHNLIMLYHRIMDGFIEGIEKRYEILNNINNHLIYGLYNYK